MAFIIFFYTFSLIKKYDTILTLYRSLVDRDKKAEIKLYLNAYPSLLNPFAELRESKLYKVLDFFGYGIHTYLYLLGLFISLRLIIVNPVKLLVIQLIILILVFLLRQDVLKLQKQSLIFVNRDFRKFKVVGIYIFIFLYLLTSFFLFKF
jgi:hypothetical protein